MAFGYVIFYALRWHPLHGLTARLQRRCSGIVVKMVILITGEIMHTSTHDDMSWTVAGAKANLLEVMERAQSAPQTIIRNGKPSVVVVTAEEWEKKTARRGSLAEFLLASPLRGADLDTESLRDEPRDLAL